MDKHELQERGLQFAVAVHTLTDRIRVLPGRRNTADQLLDCATSVGANYRAAGRGRSRAEFIAKLGLVVEECDEAVYWIEFVERAGMLPAVDPAACLDEACQLRAIFAASCGTARVNHRSARKTAK
jgi:four helix bundle protein